MRNRDHSLGLSRKYAPAFCITPAMVLTLVLAAAPAAGGQTFTVLHAFTGYEGGLPASGLTGDQLGNMFGTAQLAGNTQACPVDGCGAVYQLTRQGSSWKFKTLYRFAGPATGDGAQPMGRLTVAPDGTLYGTTFYGGVNAYSGICANIGLRSGCGTIFRLQPTLETCKHADCEWNEEVLYTFKDLGTGIHPTSEVLLDSAGNLYGTTFIGGQFGYGVVYQLSQVDGSWAYNVIHDIGSNSEGGEPFGGLVMDSAGNLFGATSIGGTGGGGVIFELSRMGEGWNFQVLYNIGTNKSDGSGPYGTLIMDPSGNLFGSTVGGGANDGGTVFELARSGDRSMYSVLADLPHGASYYHDAGPHDKLMMDAAGNLYGTTSQDGAHLQGSAFELIKSPTGYTYTSLHDFGSEYDRIFYPWSNLVFDSQGKLYGTAQGGGSGNVGAVFEISPQ